MNSVEAYLQQKIEYEKCHTVTVGGVYQHYHKTSRRYMVFDVCTNTETGEHLVVYGDINKTGYDGKPLEMWARPKDMFESFVEVDGEKVPRFKLLNVMVAPDEHSR